VTAHFPNSSDLITGIVPETPRRGLYRSGLKRVLDIAFVVGMAAFILPVTVILALAVMMTDGHWPFFVQERVGRDGRVFRMIKLRSMVKDADRRLVEHLASNARARDEWNRTQKLRHDPRVTAVGWFLRKTSLDELPQFWNVLRGEMSVVGPRPMMPSQRDLYTGQVYYALRPGVTGLWQVGDRNNTSFAARARYDAEYYNRLSLATDVAIMLRTVRVMARGTGL